MLRRSAFAVSPSWACGAYDIGFLQAFWEKDAHSLKVGAIFGIMFFAGGALLGALVATVFFGLLR